MDLLRDIYEGYEDVEVPIMEALNESVLAAMSGKTGSAYKSMKDFAKKHPVMTIAAAALAVDAYSKYKQSKRNTIKLYAKDAYEKKMMTDIVDALTKQGRFKLEKTAYADGGRVWVLKRIGV